MLKLGSSAWARAVAGMLMEKDAVTGPVVEPIGEWLVGEAKKLWPRSAGWLWFGRTNVRRTWTIVSYHHPAQLCWSWSLWLHLFPTSRGDRFSKLGFHGYNENWALTLPYVFSFRFHRQRSDWMLSGDARLRLQRAIDQALEIRP